MFWFIIEKSYFTYILFRNYFHGKSKIVLIESPIYV